MDTTEEEFIRNVQAEEHSEKLQAVSKTEVECWCDSFFLTNRFRVEVVLGSRKQPKKLSRAFHAVLNPGLSLF